MDFRFIDKGVNKGEESGEGFNREERGLLLTPSSLMIRG